VRGDERKNNPKTIIINAEHITGNYTHSVSLLFLRIVYHDSRCCYCCSLLLILFVVVVVVVVFKQQYYVVTRVSWSPTIYQNNKNRFLELEN